MTETGTATALLDAAEAEFASMGFAGASLRGIMRSAGANPAAVHYHYGSREELLGAVLDRLLGPLNDRRRTLLARAMERNAPAAVPLREVVDSLVRPDLELRRDLGGRNPAAVRLVGLIYAHPTEFVKARVEAHFAPVAAAFMPHLATALPELPAELLSWRIRWGGFGALIALLSADHDDVPLDQSDDTLDRLITFVAGGLAAPPTRVEADGTAGPAGVAPSDEVQPP